MIQLVERVCRSDTLNPNAAIPTEWVNKWPEILARESEQVDLVETFVSAQNILLSCPLRSE